MVWVLFVLSNIAFGQKVEGHMITMRRRCHGEMTMDSASWAYAVNNAAPQAMPKGFLGGDYLGTALSDDTKGRLTRHCDATTSGKRWIDML